MSPDLGEPLGHRELIRRMNAQRAAEAATRNTNPEDHTSRGTTSESDFAGDEYRASDSEGQKDQTGGRRCRIHAIRHQMTGQFYALSHEDRKAFDKHCHGIVEDLKPENHRERWLATSIAEDQWRLSRARALENNIFALGMSGEISDATDGDSPEVHAAACQARVWLADGKNLQGLSLYEQRIRRTIEKNEKQLAHLQAERTAARNLALEEALLLAEFALSEDETYDPTEDLGENGFGFSATEILRLARRQIRLRQAIQYQKQMNHGVKPLNVIPIRKSKAA